MCSFATISEPPVLAVRQPSLRPPGTARARRSSMLERIASLSPPCGMLIAPSYGAIEVPGACHTPHRTGHNLRSVEQESEMAARVPNGSGVPPIFAGTWAPAVSKPSGAQTTTELSHEGLSHPPAAVPSPAATRPNHEPDRLSGLGRQRTARAPSKRERRSPAVLPIAISARSPLP